MLEAIKIAHEAIKPQCQVQLELMEAVGKTEKRTYCHEENGEDLRKAVHGACYAKAYAQATAADTDKHHRSAVLQLFVTILKHNSVKKSWLQKLRSLTATTTMWKKRLCAAPYLTKANALTVVKLPKSVPFGRKWVTCPVSRLVHIYTWRNTSIVYRNTRHQTRRKNDRRSLDTRQRPFVALQFPAIFYRRSKSTTRCGSSRNRTRKFSLPRTKI